MTRKRVLENIALQLAALPTTGVLRVGIDGVDGAGKTTFADELAVAVEPFGRTVIRASVDGFHRPRSARYRRGSDSPEGFYEDSYDYDSLRTHLLDPLGPEGTGRYRAAAFDHHTDAPVEVPECQANTGDILLFDGIFLHRPELRDMWDFSIFLDVPFEVSYQRMALRDGCPSDPHAPRNRRYVEGQRLYIDLCHPQALANLVIDHRDFASPGLMPST